MWPWGDETDEDSEDTDEVEEIVQTTTEIEDLDSYDLLHSEPNFYLDMFLKDCMKFVQPNLRVHISGVTIACNRHVLQIYSEYFADMDRTVFDLDLTNTGIKPGIFSRLYKWAASNEFTLHSEWLLEMFYAAFVLRINKIVEQCRLFYIENDCFDEEAACMLYLDATRYKQMEDLRIIAAMMLQRIFKCFLSFVATVHFVEMSKEELCQLLQSQMIGVNSELEIFMAVVRWLQHDWNARKAALVETMDCVRFGLLPPWFLLALKMQADWEAYAFIMENVELKRRVNEAIYWAAATLCSSSERDRIHYSLLKAKYKKPMARKWVTDDRKLYETIFEKNFKVDLDYQAFLNYLTVIQDMGVNHNQSLKWV